MLCYVMCNLSCVCAQMDKLNDTSRFKADKGFKGAEGGASAGGRSEPVQVGACSAAASLCLF